jgi:hypothetical protein
MAKLPLYATGITGTFAILLMAAAGEEDALQKQAQEFFLSLPKDMATGSFR